MKRIACIALLVLFNGRVPPVATDLWVVRAQMEGAVVMGLSLALYTEISFKNGAVVNSNYNDYPVLEIHETPPEITCPADVVVECTDRTDPSATGAPQASGDRGLVAQLGFEFVREIPEEDQQSRGIRAARGGHPAALARAKKGFLEGAPSNPDICVTWKDGVPFVGHIIQPHKYLYPACPQLLGSPWVRGIAESLCGPGCVSTHSGPSREAARSRPRKASPCWWPVPSTHVSTWTVRVVARRSVNLDPAESDLTPLPHAELASLFPGERVRLLELVVHVNLDREVGDPNGIARPDRGLRNG